MLRVVGSGVMGVRVLEGIHGGEGQGLVKVVGVSVR